MISSHFGIADNEHTDIFGYSLRFYTHLIPFKIPASDHPPISRKLVCSARKPNGVLSCLTAFSGIDVLLLSFLSARSSLNQMNITLTHLCTGHCLLPHHSLQLALNSSPFLLEEAV